MTDKEELKKAIAVLEAQRAILGDAVVDTAIAPIREQLAAQEPQAGSALAPERKLITILFADVVGSTALAEQLGAETSRLILDRCLRRISEAVDEFGGTVSSLMGDGLMAFFGVPRAHEDDPERAALAAVRIHRDVADYARELDQSREERALEVRVGINTGRVVLGDMGGQVHTEYTAMGPPVNLAARLQSAARPGKTLLGESTARMVRYRFQVEPLEPLKLKGFEEPVNAYELAGELTQPAPARGILGLQSTLVGRDSEVVRLAEMAARLEEGIGGIAALIGEPGIGKSRLLQEIKETSQNGQLRFAEGRAYSYTQDQPFSVILDLLAELLDLAADDSSAIMDLKLEATLSPLFDGKLEEVWPFLATLLSAPLPPQYTSDLTGLDPEALNARMIQAVQMLVEKMAARRPLILAFEDLHWADRGSLKLIESLMLETEHFPIFLILLFRPDFDKPVWQLKLTADTHYAHRYTELKLLPLDADASTEMIGNLLQATNLPGELRHTISEKAGGNPLYVEELIRSLIEGEVLVRAGDSWRIQGDVATLKVPETLEKVIQARLDRLPPAERATLQMASVLGRRFAYRVLVDMVAADGALRRQLVRLQQVGMVREISRLPEPEYIFKHVIVQQVTYGTLLREQRRQLHRQAAETLEKLFPKRREELAGTLADHYAAAGENQKAIPFLYEAAGRAKEVYAYEEALHFLQSAQKLSKSVVMEPEERMLLLEQLADIHRLLQEGEAAILLYRETLDLFQSQKDTDKWIAVRLCRKIGQTWLYMLASEQQAQLEAQVQANLKMGLELITGEVPRKETIRLLTRTSFYVYWHKPSADWQTAEHYAQVATEMAEQLDAPVELSDALHALALASNRPAQPRDYLLLEQRRERLSRDPRFDDLPEKLDILIENALALKMVGDHARAIPLLLEAEGLAVQMQDPHQQVRTLYFQAECWVRLDRWDEVLVAEEKSQTLQRRHPLNRLGPMCWLFAFSAVVHALRGEKEIAARLAEESYAIMLDISGGDESNWHSGPFY